MLRFFFMKKKKKKNCPDNLNIYTTLKKRCLTLYEKIEILHEVKKRKLSCRAIAEDSKIKKTQGASEE